MRLSYSRPSRKHVTNDHRGFVVIGIDAMAVVVVWQVYCSVFTAQIRTVPVNYCDFCYKIFTEGNECRIH